MFMNEWDIEDARARFTRSSTSNRLALAIVVDRLREWADENSDGWAYWPKPLRAAQRAIEHIESRTYAANVAQETTDITRAEMLAAVRPIKSFLTRQGVSAERKELILRAAEEV